MCSYVLEDFTHYSPASHVVGEDNEPGEKEQAFQCSLSFPPGLVIPGLSLGLRTGFLCLWMQGLECPRGVEKIFCGSNSLTEELSFPVSGGLQTVSAGG